MTNAKFTPLITSTTGTTWVSGSNISPATVVHVLNNTGTTITFRRQGDVDAIFELPTGMAWSFRGLTNSNQLQFRRSDTSNSSVSAWGEVEFSSNEE